VENLQGNLATIDQRILEQERRLLMVDTYRELRRTDGVSVDSLDTIARFLQSTIASLKSERAAILGSIRRTGGP
jgi:hypothetical protein